MNPSLIACLAGCVLYIALLVFFFIKISKKKALIVSEGKSVKKAEVTFVCALILCALVECLPFLIVLRFYMIVIVALCGLLGEYLVLRDRLKNLAAK